MSRRISSVFVGTDDTLGIVSSFTRALNSAKERPFRINTKTYVVENQPLLYNVHEGASIALLICLCEVFLLFFGESDTLSKNEFIADKLSVDYSKFIKAGINEFINSDIMILYW